MNKQRINILTPIPFWHPGTLEFISELKKRDYSVVALDIWSFRLFNENEEYEYLCPKYLKGLPLKIYKSLFRKRVIKKNIKPSDIVDIQWCGHYYAPYMKTIEKRTRKIIATPFGSDFYRSSAKEREIQKRIYDSAIFLPMGKNISEDFIVVYPQYINKVREAQYGSLRLDIVAKLYSKENKKKYRKKYNIADHKIVVTVGYSANPLQQHFMFLDKLQNISPELKQKLYLLVPMTYGNTKEYSAKLLSKLNSLGIDYTTFQNPENSKDKWLTDTEIAEIRIISDITVNTQTTDALSSSLKEALAAENILLVGDWLPYKIYQDMGMFIVRSSENQLEHNFVDIINNFADYTAKCQHNVEIVFKFATWQAVMPLFINNYEQLREQVM